MKKDTHPQPLDWATREREVKAVWEPPTIREVGTIADLVQLTKQSGTQDCGGKKRVGTGNSCT
ncbi:MAG TPA: hypothetical protein VJN96_14265 [Vicinamibacterales bacterium]|nr:hypothetical protein [Vicinamibacterales bacterium]